MNIALHAEDAPVLDPALLVSTNAADVSFLVHPSVRLAKAAYPVDAIWRAVISEDDEALAAIDLSEGPIFLVIGRVNGAVSVERMDACAWQFTALLCAGLPLSEALADPDMSAVLAQHFRAGRFTGIRICTL